MIKKRSPSKVDGGFQGQRSQGQGGARSEGAPVNLSRIKPGSYVARSSRPNVCCSELTSKRVLLGANARTRVARSCEKNLKKKEAPSRAAPSLRRTEALRAAALRHQTQRDTTRHESKRDVRGVSSTVARVLIAARTGSAPL